MDDVEMNEENDDMEAGEDRFVAYDDPSNWEWMKHGAARIGINMLLVLTYS